MIQESESEAEPAQPTVLLVEDEVQVRQLVERLLDRQGFSILTAADGAEAVAVSGHHQGPIDLLLTDVVMPHMGGPEAAELIQLQRPAIRVIYMSGYSEEMFRLQGETVVEAAFLGKPFTPDDLRRTIRQVLAQEGQESWPV